ncbi:protein NLRC3 isoform X3 [Dendroctonus ponderosae]|uniref:protein NLRC3 isoform X3 n=1 Tax=Dendroctonus ponderosae TaxID=77166 RepID=UPI00203579FE|nr:protein NLRC3 isoform X3 [Dendroctonus ponderosae]
MDLNPERSSSVSSQLELKPSRVVGKSMQNVVGLPYGWSEKSTISIKQSQVFKSNTSTKASLTAKSSTKTTGRAGEKFKKHPGAGDLFLQQLSQKVSDQVAAVQNFCDSKHLLQRNTESFKCLAQVLLSSSSLAKNRLFLFPPLEDPGISLAFNFQEPPPINDDIGAEKYKKLCRELEIVPISRITNSLETDTLDLKYYGLSLQQIRALTEAMKANSRVQTLILQDNWLSVEMAQMLSDMLEENISLLSLSLYECRLGEAGAQKLGEALSSLQTLRSLDLSYNELGDAGLLALRTGLCENASLNTLNLSHNNITEDSAEALAAILVENKTIEDLDLSWNGFFTAQGNRKLFKGLTESDRIKALNLSWNGLGLTPAVRPMVRYLKKAQTLQEIDLSNNRLEGQSLRITRTALNKNHSLRTVRIGSNIYGPEEAHFLLTMLAGKAKDPLEYLDMDNMHLILSLPANPIQPEDLQKELKKQKMKKLDKDLVQALANLFTNKKKQVDCQALVQDYMGFYPDTQLPPPKPKKGKKGKKGKRSKEEKEIMVHDLEKAPEEAQLNKSPIDEGEPVQETEAPQ